MNNLNFYLANFKTEPMRIYMEVVGITVRRGMI